VQIDSTLIIPAPATADPISEPLLRSPSSTTHRPLPRYQRRQINNDDLIESIDRIGLKLADCLSITKLALDTTVQRRPPSDLDLSETARNTPGVAALPLGLTNVAATYHGALRGKFADQVGCAHPLADQLAVQPPPAVNMLHIGQCPGASL